MNNNNPITEIHEWCQRNFPLVEIKHSFTFTTISVEDNKVLWTAEFIDPRNKEKIPSGSIQECGVSTFNGVNYYQTKKEAQRAAALTFLLRQHVENDSDQNNNVARELNAIDGTKLMPKKEIHEYFSKVVINLDDYFNIIESKTDHTNPLYSCVFTHPNTKEDFPAGILKGLDTTTMNGVHYYSKKKSAKHAASAFFLDTMQLRHIDDNLCTTTLCTNGIENIVPTTKGLITVEEEDSVVPTVSGEILCPSNVGCVKKKVLKALGPYACFADGDPFTWKARNASCSEMKHDIENSPPHEPMIDTSMFRSEDQTIGSVTSIPSVGSNEPFSGESHLVINTVEKLDTCCEEMKKCKCIAFDAEFYNNNIMCVLSMTYIKCKIDKSDHTHSKYEETGITKKTVVIDTIKLSKDIARLLGPIFSNEKLIKIAHAVGGDAHCLYHSFGIGIKTCFDTQLGYSCIRENNPATKISLLSLAGEVFSETSERVKSHSRLKSDHQTADWTERPITQEMADYSSFDSKYLDEIAHWMLKQRDSLDLQKILAHKVMAQSKRLCLRLEIPVPSRSFELAPLYSTVVRNKVMGFGFGSKINETNMQSLKKLLIWRTSMALKFGISMEEIINDNSVVKTALSNNEEFVVLHDKLSELLQLKFVNK